MSLAERIALVNEKIAAAARQAGREPSEVQGADLRHHPAGHCRRRHHLR